MDELIYCGLETSYKTRFSCALRDDEAMCWVSIGQLKWLVLGGNESV